MCGGVGILPALWGLFPATACSGRPLPARRDRPSSAPCSGRRPGRPLSAPRSGRPPGRPFVTTRCEARRRFHPIRAATLSEPRPYPSRDRKGAVGAAPAGRQKLAGRRKPPVNGPETTQSPSGAKGTARVARQRARFAGPFCPPIGSPRTARHPANPRDSIMGGCPSLRATGDYP